MSSADRLLAALKRTQPAKVRAYSGDDEYRDLAVPGGKRKRWAHVVAALARTGTWSRCELLDKRGDILDAVDNTDAAGEVEDIATGGGKFAEVERMVAIVTRAQRDALAARDAEMRSILTAQSEVMRELTAGMRALTGLYQEQVKAASELAQVRAEAQFAPEPDQMKQLVELLPHLPALVQMGRSLLGGDAAPPANGARKVQ